MVLQRFKVRPHTAASCLIIAVDHENMMEGGVMFFARRKRAGHA